MTDLNGRVALVTGSNKGIGRGIARRFAADGAELVLNGRDLAQAERMASQIHDDFGVEPLVVAGDITAPSMTEELVARSLERFGRLDILVNNAWSGTRVNRLENKSPAMFETALDIAFYASLRLMNAAFPHMKANGWGRIINIASLNGVNAHACTADYNVAKEALRTLTRTAAREWFRHGIVANVICPFARVERHDVAWGDEADEIAARVGGALPSGRMGDPETDIGGVAAFLASEDARFLTGNTLFVDGGGHISGIPWEPVPEEETGGVAVETAIHRRSMGS
jgi:NAD(P)-dependent dehydrogenase (short-subunit alcohol dehydrogenase family)